MPDTRGTLNLAVPAVVSNALLRKISADCSYRRRTGERGAPADSGEAAGLLLPSGTCVPHPQFAISRPWRTSAPGKLLSFPEAHGSRSFAGR